jgi:hypothetical protein
LLQIDVYSSRAVIRSQEPLTVGMVGAKAHIHFAEPWQTLTKTVVFRQGEVTRDVVGVTKEAEIPWEVLQQPGEPVEIGFYGSKSNGSVVIPTVWVETEPVCEGADPSGDPSTAATLPVYQQLQEQMEAADQQLQEQLEAGDRNLQKQIDRSRLLVVNVTNDNGTLTMDPSFNDVHYALQGSIPVALKYAGRYYLLREDVVHTYRFCAVWKRGDYYVIGHLLMDTDTGVISAAEQELPPGDALQHIVSDYDTAMGELRGRLDEHAGSIDALNFRSLELEYALDTKALELEKQILGCADRLTEQEEQLSGAVRRSDVQILQFAGLEEPAVYDPVGDSADPITVDLSKISGLIEHGQTLESHSESLEKLNTDVDDLEAIADQNGQDLLRLTSRVNTQSQRVDELYGFSQTNTENLRDLDTRLGEVEEALENVGQGGTGGGSGVHIGTEPPVDETVSVWVNPEGDAAWSDAAYYDETVTVEEAANSQTLHFPCPIADFYELHIHMTGANSVSKLYMEAGGISTYLIDPQHGTSSGTHIHLMATHQRDTMNLDVTTAAYSENAQPSVPTGVAGIGNEAASLRLYSKDGGNDLLTGMKIRVWGVYKTQVFGTLNVKNPETGEWESLKTLRGERGKDGDDYILTEEDKQEIAEQAAGLVDVPEYELPVANPDTLGGVQPVAKTDKMTNPVGVDALGGLWSAGDSGSVQESDELLIDFTTEEEVTSIFLPLADNAEKISNAKQLIVQFMHNQPATLENIPTKPITLIGLRREGQSWNLLSICRGVEWTPSVSYKPFRILEAFVTKAKPIPGHVHANGASYQVCSVNIVGVGKNETTTPISTSECLMMDIQSDSGLYIESTLPIGVGSTVCLYARGVL